MALRKPLFMSGTEGFSEEMAATDSIQLGALEMSGQIDMNSNKIVELGTPTAATDAATKGYVDNVAIASRSWKELLLVKEQLLDGASGAVLQAILADIVTNPTANDTFVITDGTVTETFTFKATETAAFEVLIGANAAATEVNLVQAINDDSTLWSAVSTTGLDKYFTGSPTGQFVIYRTANSNNNDRVYGTLTAPTGIQVVHFATAGDYAIAAGTQTDLPAADPAAKRFGFSRAFASLFTNETHLIAEDITTYTWDTDDQLWRQTDISATVAGKGILKTGNTLDVELDTDAAATGAGNGGGSSGLEFDVAGAAGQLRAAVSATGAIERASDGLKVRVDGTTITISGNQLVATASPEAQKVENTWTSATDTIVAGDPVYWNGNNTVGKARADDDAKAHVIGLNRSAGGAAPQSLEVVKEGVATGVISGATFNTGYYLGETGGLALFAALTAGDRVIRMGYAKNATDLDVAIMDLGKKAA